MVPSASLCGGGVSYEVGNWTINIIGPPRWNVSVSAGHSTVSESAEFIDSIRVVFASGSALVILVTGSFVAV